VGRRRTNEVTPYSPVGAQSTDGRLEGTLHDAGRAVVERMGEVDLGLAPFESETLRVE
jgi:hypothetical protein